MNCFQFLFFQLTISSDADGADALGSNLWNLTAFLSRYENGSDPISVTPANIGEDTNTILSAGGEIVLAADVTLNAENLVCDSDTEIFLCVKLDKGDGVEPDFTLEGLGEFEGSLQICQPFACRGE